MHTFWLPNEGRSPRHSLHGVWKLVVIMRQLGLSESLEGIEGKALPFSTHCHNHKVQLLAETK